jgi:pimeloyl-ACP methyl ester carboxylesterase
LPKDLYILSGLGADERAFQRLEFPGFHTVFIKWEQPAYKERIEDYATKLLRQIPSPKPILIGLSFGGMVAVEIAKQIATEKVILIASAKNQSEIPFYYRWGGQLGLHSIMPTRLLLSSNFITNWFFGAKSLCDKQILKQILTDTDPFFFKWALEKITQWENKEELKNLIHIHGTSDRILPFMFINCDFPIKKGRHLMTLNKPSELNKILKEELIIHQDQ